jgi:asparagine synthetase B (glutamine-hydrolysing)
MSITEKYPEDIPWDLKIYQNDCKSIQWMLTKSDIEYTFTRSRINEKYVYIQKNDGKKQAIKEYEARFTYQRLFDEGYSLVALS